MSYHNQFNQTTHPLTAGVYTAIAAIDVACAWRFLNSYLEPTSEHLDDHLRSLNKFWRDQFSTIDTIDTRAVRSYLIDRCLLHDYLRLFAIHVAPIVVSLDLPQATGPVEVPQFYANNGAL